MKKILFILSLTAVFVSCNNDDDDIVVEKAIELNEVEKVIAVEQSGFAVDLFSAVSATQKEEGNMVVSPLSTSMALSMLAGGVEQQISEKILSGLGFGNYTLDEVNAYNKKLYEGLPNVSSLANVSLANSLWLNSGNTTVKEYKNTLRNDYDADVYNCDFAGERTLEEINKWCYTNTNKMIPNFVEKIEEDAPFMLFNSLSFKSAWKTSFDEVKKGVFNSIDSVKQPADFISHTVRCVFGDVEDKFSFVRIPYESPYEMVIVLPKVGVTLDECVNALHGNIWGEVINSSNSPYLINIELPKFEITSSDESIKETLGAMNIPLKAHTSQIIGLNIADAKDVEFEVMQANTVTVDEQGTSAATVTQVIPGDIVPGPYHGPEFIADRPFIFFVYEKGSGTILYIGKVVTM